MFDKTFLFLILSSVIAVRCEAALILNSPQPIIETVTVQPIIVSDDNGSNTATYFGDAGQQSIITGLINQIWAQAGIQVQFLAPNFWSNTFANSGNGTDYTTTARPFSDLGTIVANGDAVAGVGNADPLIIDMYFVNISAGFNIGSLNSARGLAALDGNGITMYVGSNLLSFTGGQEVIAKVAAHEIGHNLSLDHIVEAENLMQSGGSGGQARLNSTQIAASIASPLSVSAVPEPTSMALLTFAIVGVAARKLRSRIAAV